MCTFKLKIIFEEEISFLNKEYRIENKYMNGKFNEII